MTVGWCRCRPIEVVDEVMLHCPRCAVEWAPRYEDGGNQCWLCDGQGERGRAPGVHPPRRLGPVTVRIVDDDVDDDDEEDDMERECHLRLVPDPVSGVMFGDDPLGADCVQWGAVLACCGGFTAVGLLAWLLVTSFR